MSLPTITLSPLPPETSPKNNTASGGLDLHPIQLEYVAVKELTIRSKIAPSREYILPPGQALFTGGISPFDESARKFQVAFAVTIGDTEFTRMDLPLYLRVDIVGGFVVTSPEIKGEDALAWAHVGARFTLLPYIREHVASLSGRAGYCPLILPLLQVPVLQPTIAAEATN
jgi:hypothetical protein